MDPLVALVVVALLLVGATSVGLLWKSRQGHVVSRSAPTDFDFAALGVDSKAKTTLLQFSTEFCSYCPGTRRALGSLAREVADVSFFEYDLTDDVEAARRFGITQTPTVFVIDRGRTLVARIGGAPRVVELRELLAKRGHGSTEVNQPQHHDERKRSHASG